MKNIIIFFIFFFSHSLYSIDTTKLYQALELPICKNENIVPCDKRSYLMRTEQYFKLDNNQLLFFFHNVNPNASPYKYGVQNAAVIFDIHQNWQVVEYVFAGYVTSIQRDRQGGIWVYHPWMIEGLFPRLSFSKDGLKWKSVKLPPRENFNPSSDLEFLLLDSEIAFKYNDGENGDENSYWIVDYKNALAPNPKWQKISSKRYHSYRSLSATSLNNFWFSEVQKKEALEFYNRLNGKRFTLPKKIYKNMESNKTLYSIQVGSFSQEESLRSATKALKEISNYPLIAKKVSLYHKLFIGSFETKEEAKKILEELKRIYPNNKYFHQSFVTILPEGNF